MVCGSKWDDSASLAACRSMGCSKAAWSRGYDYQFPKDCLLQCNGMSASMQCETIVDYIACPADAMGLLECLTKPLFQGCAYNGGEIYLACSEC